MVKSIKLRWFAQVKGVRDGLLAGGGDGALGCLTVGSGKGDQVYPVADG
jgi:hypothetical protein